MSIRAHNESFVDLVETYGNVETISRVASICYNDKGLPNIEKLLEQKHMSPFEFMSFLFYIETPIFVARQIMRHRAASYMEKSLRFTEPEDFYFDNDIDVCDYMVLLENAEKSYNLYCEMVGKGLTKQQARSVLPFNTMTKFYMQINLRSLINFFEQRLAPKAQKETREVAQKMFEFLPIPLKVMLGKHLEVERWKKI
jgi:thymidylate synthase (FAD)